LHAFTTLQTTATPPPFYAYQAQDSARRSIGTTHCQQQQQQIIPKITIQKSQDDNCHCWTSREDGRERNEKTVGFACLLASLSQNITKLKHKINH